MGADAPAGLIKLTEDEPAVAANLISEICRVLWRVDDVSLGKGATVLPGEFTERSSGKGMATLARLPSPLLDGQPLQLWKQMATSESRVFSRRP